MHQQQSEDDGSNDSMGFNNLSLRRSGRNAMMMGNNSDDNNGNTNMAMGRRLRPKKSSDLSDFMGDFDPGRSERAQRKQIKKTTASQALGKNKGSLYDNRGLLLSNRLDVCDCMSPSCPGCHFPCSKCGSGMCGLECRNNRKWQYETVELDGIEGSIRKNPNLVNSINRPEIPEKS